MKSIKRTIAACALALALMTATPTPAAAQSDVIIYWNCAVFLFGNYIGSTQFAQLNDPSYIDFTWSGYACVYLGQCDAYSCN